MTSRYTILDAAANEDLALQVLDDMTDEALVDREFMPVDEKATLLSAIRASRSCHLVIVDGQPAAVGGVIPSDDGWGFAYMTLAKPFLASPKTALRIARRLADEYNDIYEHIHNINADRKTRTMRFLRAVGFEIAPGFSHNGEPVSVVSRTRSRRK